MTLKNLCRNLKKKGLDAQEVMLCNFNDAADTFRAVMVYHDYEGLYPTDEARKDYHTAMNYARKNGFHAEERGYCQATLIYEQNNASRIA